MKDSIRLILLFLLNILGINAVCRILNRNKYTILWYHGICDEDFNLLRRSDERHIPGSVFRQHLIYLKKKGYRFINMSEMVDNIRNRRRMSKPVVLTFDDGFLNIVKNAYPLMKEYGAKGCFYLVSDLVGTDRLLWTDYIETMVRSQQKGKMQFVFRGKRINYALEDNRSYDFAMKDIKEKLRMVTDKERHELLQQFKDMVLKDIPREFSIVDWEQVKSLDPNIMEIGSHTGNHPNCENLSSEEELRHEIGNSRTVIESEIGREIKHFAYPAGSFNDGVIEKLKEYNYESAVTIEYGFNDENSDLYRLKRVGTSSQLLYFKAGISGSYGVLHRISMFMKSVIGKVLHIGEKKNGSNRVLT